MIASRARRLAGKVLSSGCPSLARKCALGGEASREAITVYGGSRGIVQLGAASASARFFASAVGRSRSVGLGGDGTPVRAFLEAPQSTVLLLLRYKSDPNDGLTLIVLNVQN